MCMESAGHGDIWASLISADFMVTVIAISSKGFGEWMQVTGHKVTSIKAFDSTVKSGKPSDAISSTCTTQFTWELPSVLNFGSPGVAVEIMESSLEG